MLAAGAPAVPINPALAHLEQKLLGRIPLVIELLSPGQKPVQVDGTWFQGQ